MPQMMNTPLVNIHTHRPTGTAIEPTFSGIHPWDAASQPLDAIRPSIAGAGMVGEIGLDYACTTDREAQRRLFREQLTLAEEFSKPVILHCVKAFEPVMEELAHHRLPAVIFHGFIGSPQQAARAIEKGYYLSFGERTFSSPRTVEALRAIPEERLLAETDESPLTIEQIYRQIAEIRGVTVERLRDQIYHNYEAIFKR